MVEETSLPNCADQLKVLAVEARLHIVRWLMKKGSGTVSQIGEALQLEQSLLSHHLKILRDAGFVESEKNKKTRIYSLTLKASSSICEGKLDLGCCSIEF